ATPVKPAIGLVKRPSKGNMPSTSLARPSQKPLPRDQLDSQDMTAIVSNHRALLGLAWLNVVLHGAGLGFATLGMRPGTPLAALPDRLASLARFPLGWSLGWGVWMLCALALVGFCAVLAYYLREPADLVRLALMVVTAGGAFDLFCDAVFVTVLPD